MNITKALHAVADSRIPAQFRPLDWVVDTFVEIDWRAARDLLSMAQSKGLFFRMIAECADGTRRDVSVRQGVHYSVQDGPVRNVGHAMATTEDHVGTWRQGKVSKGARSGYRTFVVSRVLAIKIEGITYLTDRAVRELTGT